MIKNLNTSDSESENLSEKDIINLMKIDYSYPNQNDSNFQYKIYKKREFYYNKIPYRNKLSEYKDIKKFRDDTCGGKFNLRSHQSLLSNFINPNTPFKGILIYHGVGTGKCVHKDTLINIIEEKRKKIKIFDIWEENKNSNIYIDEEKGEWLKLEKEIYVESYNNNINKLEKKKIINIYREKISNYLLEIIVEGNYYIICSINHMLYKENIGWTNILNINDYILINDNNNLLYKKIIEINRLDYNNYIYDLEIEFNHSYIANNIVCHNTCAGIAIAENFKEQIKKYGTKIYILVSGPLIKETWRDEIIKCTKETYLNDDIYNSGYINDYDRNKKLKNAKILTRQFYKIISYRSFYKKVLGHKIVDKKSFGNKLKKKFRKTLEGDYERYAPIDKLESLNNTILIIDEAHSITNNEYGKAVKKIINNSINLKIILITATPMINFADEIVDLLNYIRPVDDPILREKIFTSDKSHIMSFKEGGENYLKKMSNGYVSHYRGGNPFTFAEQIDMGIIPKELLYTKLFRCNMLNFQIETYNNILLLKDDSLDRRSQAVSNFCFPGLSNDKKDIIGYHSKDGLTRIRLQLKSNKQLLQKMINDKFFEGKLIQNEIIKDSEKNKSITGLILKKDNLKFFSIKFYNALINLENLVEGKNGSGTVFIYFNLVKVGINLFTEVLEMNGYLEYNETGNYIINDNNIDAITGLTYFDFKNKFQNRTFYPSTYITLTGQSEDTLFQLPEIKKKILDNVFSDITNKDGRYIKIVLGSKVMNEGITLENVSEVHIMDVYYNLAKVHQVIGRALRECKHYKTITDDNPFPNVKVYRYVVSLNNDELTTEEIMYQKAERKYFLVKETERILKEVSIDCPINYNGNIFPEEIEKYKNCTTLNELIKMPINERNNILICPDKCDFKKCCYKCYDTNLNLKYYDSNKPIYKKISKENIDFSTFTTELARYEIDIAKNKIKELYRFKYVYTLEECIELIKKDYIDEKKDLFEEFFVFKALDELVPIAENDFNNFIDTIYDKFNIIGYLIYRNHFYIFQPFDQNEDLPMHYRSTYYSNLFNDISLFSYLKTTEIFSLMYNNDNNLNIIKTNNDYLYNFKDIIQYYDSKKEYDYVGIIDKSNKKYKYNQDIEDIFKIRKRRDKVLNKKRGTGIPSLTGAVCKNSRKKKELINIAKFLKINIDKKLLNKYNEINSRIGICKLISDKLHFLEKYSTEKENNKFTYFIIPSNHKIYKFPINLEDRIDFLIKKIQNKVLVHFDYTIDVSNNGIFNDIRDISYAKYIVNINNIPVFNKFISFFQLNDLIFNKKTNIWSIIIE